MATKYFTGEAVAVAQVATASIDTVDGTPADNTFTVTIGGVAISVVGDTNVNTTATNLRAALNASTHPYFAAITWSGASADIVGTADVAGVPFVATLTETGAGSGTVTDFAATTDADGPNFWSSAANWSTGSVPVSTDDVIIEGTSTNIVYGLAQSAVTLASLTIRKTFTGKIGLNLRAFATSADADTVDATVNDYRDDYLDIGYDNADIGQHVGPGQPAGSSRIKLDNAKAGASTTVVHDTASSASETGFPAVRLIAANANADVVVRGARAGVGIALDEPGETTTIGDLDVSGGLVFVGEGVTVTNVRMNGGTVAVQAAATITLVEIDDGTLTTEGNYTITTLTVNGGQVFCNHTSGGNAITTLNMNGGRIDGRGNLEPRTWATVNPDEGTILVDDGVVTITTFDAPAGSKTISVS